MGLSGAQKHFGSLVPVARARTRTRLIGATVLLISPHSSRPSLGGGGGGGCGDSALAAHVVLAG